MARIAYLGAGAMGSRMARALLRAGHEVTVWNRSPEALEALAAEGGRPAETPRLAVAEAAFALSMVRDDAASRAVWLAPETGALAGLAETTLALECSTVTVGWAKELAGHMGAAGCSFLDAPVAGSRPQADAGALIFLAGGAEDVVARAEPVLLAMGSAVHHVGPAGSGAALKLALNALFGIQVATMAELIGVLTRAGVDPARAVEILGATPVCSPAAKGAAGAMLAHAFAPQFPIDLVVKDFGYVADVARAGNTAAPLAAAAGEVFEAARRAGCGGKNITAVAKLYAN